MSWMMVRPSLGWRCWRVALAMVLARGNGAAWGQDGPAAPAGSEGPPAPSSADAPPPTRATIVSTGAQQWDVLIDDQLVCSTPCSGPLFPQQFVVLNSQERRPVILEVGYLPPGDLTVSAKPLDSGSYVGGIVATTLGGMALAIGITFLSVGLAKDRSGLTTAGLITGTAGALALPGGILLMVRAVPSVSVEPVHRGPLGATAGISAQF